MRSSVAKWDPHPSKPLPPLACQGTSPWAPFLFAVTPQHPPRLWGLPFHFLRDPQGKVEKNLSWSNEYKQSVTKDRTKDTAKVPHSHGSHVYACLVMAMRSPSNQQMSWLKYNISGYKVPWCSSQTWLWTVLISMHGCKGAQKRQRNTSKKIWMTT